MAHDDTAWREKHAELHGEIQITLRHIDKNMDELAALIEKNANKRDHAVEDLYERLGEHVRFRTNCREEILKELTTIKTSMLVEAKNAAKSESKKWSIIVVVISTALGILGGIIVSALTHGMY